MGKKSGSPGEKIREKRNQVLSKFRVSGRVQRRKNMRGHTSENEKAIAHGLVKRRRERRQGCGRAFFRTRSPI